MRPFQPTPHRAIFLGLVAALLISLLPPAGVTAQPEPPRSPAQPVAPGLTQTPQRVPQGPRVPPGDFVPAPLRPDDTPKAGPGRRGGVLPNGQAGLPLAFSPQEGKGPLADRFTSAGAGWSAVFDAQSITFSLSQAPAPELVGKAARFLLPRLSPDATLHPSPAPITVTLRFLQAQSGATLQGLGRLKDHARVYGNHKPSHTALYHRLRYRDLYPGISLTFASVRGQLKSVYEVAPRSDPAQIRWSYSGAGPVRLDNATGQLLVHHPTDHQRVLFREQKPVAWQETRAGRVFVEARYQVEADGSVRFALGTYNARLPLIIDPVLVTSSYLGGSGEDQGSGIAVDGSGNLYLVLTTNSPDLPTVNPLYGPRLDTCPWCYDIWVGKFSPDGQTLLAATYLGGTEDEYVYDVTLGPDGRLYLVGETNSPDLPTVNALQPTLSSVLPYETDGFVIALTSDLSAIAVLNHL